MSNIRMCFMAFVNIRKEAEFRYKIKMIENVWKRYFNSSDVYLLKPNIYTFQKYSAVCCIVNYWHLQTQQNSVLCLMLYCLQPLIYLIWK